MRIRGVGAWKNGFFPYYGLLHAESGILGLADQGRRELIVGNDSGLQVTGRLYKKNGKNVCISNILYIFACGM